jgi:hypothetical protein
MQKIKNLLIATSLMLCGSFMWGSAIANDNDTTIKLLAILPFKVHNDTKNLPNGISDENVMRRSQIESYRFQRALHTWLIKKQQNYNVVFQDIITTNKILKLSGLTDPVKLLKQQLCTALGVDAVIFGNIYVINPKEKVSSNVFRTFTGIETRYYKIKLELNIYDGEATYYGIKQMIIGEVFPLKI